MVKKCNVRSLSLDLLRVALGLHRGAYKMAELFSLEAQKRCEDVRDITTQPYIKKLIDDIQNLLQAQKNEDADHFLMYSVLFHNAAQKSK